MTATATAAPAGTRAGRRTSVAAVAVTVARVALALQFAGGGLLKLTGSAAMVDMFTDIGAGSWLRYLVGVLELAGAIGLLVPRLAGAAATGIVALMVGAAITNVVALGTSPAVPLVLLVVAACIAYARRASTARLLHSLRS